MIAILKGIWLWQEAAHWRSWVTHTGVAVLYVLLLWPVLGWTAACVASVFAFLVREVEQAVHMAFASGQQPWLDRVMDVAAPIVGLGFLSWLLI
jgi:hypothetical protein